MTAVPSTPPSGPPEPSGEPADRSLACVVLAHTDPPQVRRLVAALAPLPVFLHCDVSAPAEVFDEMAAGLPPHCRLLPRMATGWARFENVQAELAGYRAALAGTRATHVAVLTGTDYPLVGAGALAAFFARHAGRSFAEVHPLPYDQWGRSGGFARVRYRHWVWRKRMLRLPLPRRLPRGVVFAGGSQLKVLARHHAAAVVAFADRRPDVVRFFRRTWVADETFVLSALSSPGVAPDWETSHVPRSLWVIAWTPRTKSPPWLGMAELDRLRQEVAAAPAEAPALFARKFATAHDTDILDALDEMRQGSRR